MTGIDPAIAVHRLQVDPDHPPFKQKRRKIAPERNKAVNEEVQKLLDIGSVREVHYPDWLANVVIVRKKNGKWRVCIDFTDLNKACPKDSFPLPHIDMLVDATAGHELLSFMDAFSGYNQILMHPDDQEKTAFITERGIFCYKVMPFGLKNAGATYQRLVNKMFADYLGNTMEVYIDDMLVKSLLAEQHLDHLRQAFEVLQKYGMKLNPTKCSFGVAAVSEGAVSAVLVREEEGKQFPVYYVSKSLLDAETRYTQLEKLALALVTAARKLRPYFQCHPITVYTTYPLKSILHKPELSGRLTKWTVELSEYDITFQPRTALKSQVLADFVADFAPNVTQQADKELLNLTEHSNSKWTLTVDGSSNVNGAGIGLVLTSPEGDLIQQAIRCGFKATNNEAEYEALIAGLNLAKDMGIKKLSIRSDSQLVVNQLLGSYQARDLKMASYLEHIKVLQPAFEEFDISQIPRADNSHADALANLGSSIPSTESQTIPLLYLQWPAVWKDPPAEITTIDASDSWMTPIVSYLTSDELPEDRNEARRLRAKAARFTIHDGKLLKRSFSGPYLRCVTPIEASHVLSELHDGECGNHSGGRSLANRALTAGYYWPTMRSDSTSHVKRCDSCQRFAAVSHLPPEQLRPILSPWPFMKWGMDIVGKLPTAPGQRMYMLAFISFDFQDFCKDWGIQLSFSTPRYPQANGQAESTNKTVINIIKRRLEKAKGLWADELPGVLWAYRTTAKTSTGETPFALAYGTEAVIPVECGIPSARYMWLDEDSNTELLNHSLDAIDELRDKAHLRTALYQQKVAQHYNKNIRVRTFKTGDWVLRRVFQNTKEAGAGKLGPNWEGPYKITKIVGHGAYKLQARDGRDIHNSWNATHLKLYHF
ncbi:hypothetical protein UlMin_030185 [Ulmus minor]